MDIYKLSNKIKGAKAYDEIESEVNFISLNINKFRYNYPYSTEFYSHPIITLLNNENLAEEDKLKTLKDFIKLGITNIRVNIGDDIEKNILNFLIVRYGVTFQQENLPLIKRFIDIILNESNTRSSKRSLQRLLQEIDSEGQTVLDKALESNNFDLVRQLLEKGAIPSSLVFKRIESEEEQINYNLLSKYSPLSQAIYHKNNQIIKLLVQTANNKIERDDLVLLLEYIVTNINNEDVIDLFNIIYPTNEIDIMRIVFKQQQLLLSKLFEPNKEIVASEDVKKLCNTLFMHCSKQEFMHFLSSDRITQGSKKLINQFITEHKQDAKKLMGLLSEGILGKQAVIRLLETKKVWLNYQNHITTPMHLAVEWQDIEIFKLLLNYGANPNIKNIDGTPLLCHALEKSGNFIFFIILLTKGVDVNMEGASGETPLHIAVFHKSFKSLAPLFLKKGANINAQDKARNTPLHIAVKCHNIEAAKFFLDNQADSSIINAQDKAPLDIAKAKGYKDIEAALLPPTKIDISTSTREIKEALIQTL